VKVVDKWSRLPELVRTAQGKEAFKRGLDESKDENSSDTKKKVYRVRFTSVRLLKVKIGKKYRKSLRSIRFSFVIVLLEL
jgi:hypothetical protein